MVEGCISLETSFCSPRVTDGIKTATGYCLQLLYNHSMLLLFGNIILRLIHSLDTYIYIYIYVVVCKEITLRSGLIGNDAGAFSKSLTSGVSGPRSQRWLVHNCWTLAFTIIGFFATATARLFNSPTSGQQRNANNSPGLHGNILFTSVGWNSCLGASRIIY